MEVEDAAGRGINAGEWREEPPCWVLYIKPDARLARLLGQRDADYDQQAADLALEVNAELDRAHRTEIAATTLLAQRDAELAEARADYQLASAGMARQTIKLVEAEAALTAEREAHGQAVVERTAQLAAHRVCTALEHDANAGRLHGYCLVCGVPWPCDYAGRPLAKAGGEEGGEGDG